MKISKRNFLKIATARRIIKEIENINDSHSPPNSEDMDLIRMLNDHSSAEYDLRTKTNAVIEFRNLLRFAQLPSETPIDSIPLHTFLQYIDSGSVLWRTKSEGL